MNNADLIKRLPERNVVENVRERLVRARIESVLSDLAWLVEEGGLDVTNNARRFALNAQANAQALARKVGVAQ